MKILAFIREANHCQSGLDKCPQQRGARQRICRQGKHRLAAAVVAAQQLDVGQRRDGSLDAPGTLLELAHSLES